MPIISNYEKIHGHTTNFGLSNYERSKPNINCIFFSAPIRYLRYKTLYYFFLFVEVDRAFKQFVFECMDLTSTDEDGNVIPLQFKQRDVPWDDPYPYFKVSSKVTLCYETTQ